jgi:hypothetical protein
MSIDRVHNSGVFVSDVLSSCGRLILQKLFYFSVAFSNVRDECFEFLVKIVKVLTLFEEACFILVTTIISLDII